MEQEWIHMSLRVAQEEQVKHWVGPEEVDEGPAENPTTQSEETESGHNQQHILHERRRARLGGLAWTIRQKQLLNQLMLFNKSCSQKSLQQIIIK